MAISAISNNASLFPQNAVKSQKSANVASAQKKISNADGDTLKLSGNTQGVTSKSTVYAPPKPVNRSNDLANPQIKSFLDKIANGTATEQDLKDMQNVVQKDLGATGISNTISDSPDASPIKNFLLKVANGTATDADLKSMQSVLKQSQQQVTSTSGSGTDSPLMKKS